MDLIFSATSLPGGHVTSSSLRSLSGSATQRVCFWHLGFVGGWHRVHPVTTKDDIVTPPDFSLCLLPVSKKTLFLAEFSISLFYLRKKNETCCLVGNSLLLSQAGEQSALTLLEHSGGVSVASGLYSPQ